MTFAFATIVFFYLTPTGLNDLGWLFTVALVATTLNYLVGDLFVLPNFGNIAASSGDGIMAALTAYIFDLITIDFATNLSSLIIFAVLVALGEYLFHQYLVNTEHVAPNTSE